VATRIVRILIKAGLNFVAEGIDHIRRVVEGSMVGADEEARNQNRS